MNICNGDNKKCNVAMHAGYPSTNKWHLFVSIVQESQLRPISLARWFSSFKIFFFFHTAQLQFKVYVFFLNEKLHTASVRVKIIVANHTTCHNDLILVFAYLNPHTHTYIGALDWIIIAEINMPLACMFGNNYLIPN